VELRGNNNDEYNKKIGSTNTIDVNKKMGNTVSNFNKKPSIHSNNEEQKNPSNDNLNNNNDNNVEVINNNLNFAKTQYDNQGFGNGYFNDKVDFNPDKYVKPNPFYGLIHDKYVNPSDNPENLAKIEKEKTLKKTQELKNATGTNFYNIPNMSQVQFNNMNNTIGGTNTKFNATNTKFNVTNNNQYNQQPGLTNNSLMNTTNLNNALNKTSSSMMSKTATNSFGVSKGKLSYAQQLDQFMATNNLKYIEPPKPPEPEPQPEPVVEEPVEPEPIKGKGKTTTTNSKKGKK
jgi:hypothetical protein